jgi:hypothetical protein
MTKLARNARKLFFDRPNVKFLTREEFERWRHPAENRQLGAVLLHATIGR